MWENWNVKKRKAVFLDRAAARKGTIGRVDVTSRESWAESHISHRSC
jgi:hypothetical protein